jgi:AraC-like DNA-binding protein
MITYIALSFPLFVTFFWGLVFFIQFGQKDLPKMNLGIFMVLGFMLYFSHAIFFSHFYKLYVALEFVYLFSMLAIYPMYYRYLKLLTNNQSKIKNQFIHFLPAFIFSFLALITTLLLSPEKRMEYVKVLLIERNLKNLDISTFIGIKAIVLLLSRVTLVVQVLYYLIKGISLANKYNEAIADYYSNTEGKTLNWVRLINIIILVVSLSSISLVFIGRSYFAQHENILVIPSIIFSSVLFTIGFKGNLQKHQTFQFDNEEMVELNSSTLNLQNSKLKDEFLRLFEEDKVFTNCDLRIIDLSEMLATNRTYISKLINEEFNMNFNEFVNNYRVETAKKYLSSPDFAMFKLEIIAEKSGFNSFSSFARVFKNITGTTPGNFRKNPKD